MTRINLSKPIGQGIVTTTQNAFYFEAKMFYIFNEPSIGEYSDMLLTL